MTIYILKELSLVKFTKNLMDDLAIKQRYHKMHMHCFRQISHQMWCKEYLKTVANNIPIIACTCFKSASKTELCIWISKNTADGAPFVKQTNNKENEDKMIKKESLLIHLNAVKGKSKSIINLKRLAMAKLVQKTLLSVWRGPYSIWKSWKTVDISFACLNLADISAKSDIQYYSAPFRLLLKATFSLIACHYQ